MIFVVRALVGAGAGYAILNMRPSTAVTYAGDVVATISIRSETKPLKLVMGYLGGKPRRLTQAFTDACQL